MTMKHLVAISTLFTVLAAPLAAQTPDPPKPDPKPEKEAKREARPFRVDPPRVKVIVGDPEALYDQAREAIENSQFDRALEELNRVIAQVNRSVNLGVGVGVGAGLGAGADAAMYWKAYSQSKLALSAEALQTIQDMAKQFALSPWVKDAKALELEIREAAGQPVSAELQGDEELKLLALRGVMRTDPDKGLPIIEKMLAGGATPRVRDRALFVLSQSRSPRARDIMVNTAKNNADPDLQLRAIRYLGFMGGAADREQLADIYRTSSNVSVKRSILQSYFMNGNVEKLTELARSEKDSELRLTIIRDLGMMNRPGTSETLVSIYGSDASTDVRKAIVNGLFIQRNAKALVDLARSEKDPVMKKEIVQKLSVMKAPEATDYMLELLK
jgi:HEAT repeat protein